MGLLLKTVGIKKWKKRKTTDSKLTNPEGIKKKRNEKEKKSSSLFETDKKTPLDAQAVKPERNTETEVTSSSEPEGTSSSEPEVTTSSKPEVTTSSKPKVTTKPEIAAKEEGDACPRGKQWEAAAKFCRKLYKLSVHYFYKHEELMKFKALADMTAKSVEWCNMKCPGPLRTDDDFRTPWGPVDENRLSMFEFLGEVQELEKVLTTKCLEATDTEAHEKLRKAKKWLNVALEADPVLEYVMTAKPWPRGGLRFTKAEIQRIKFCYRLRRWYKPTIAYDEMAKFFNNRTTEAVKRRFKAILQQARLWPLPKIEKTERNKMKAERRAARKAKKEEANESSSEESEDSSSD